MDQRGKLYLAGTLLLAGLGLVGATSAWFVSLSQTPAGVVNAALVRCLPERGAERSADSLLAYGSLISGNGVDVEGTPLVLPGDSLLSTQEVRTEKTGAGAEYRVRVTRTSLARDFQTGETPGTVIYGEERRDADGVSVFMTRRDLMETGESGLWYENAEGTGTGSETAPGFDPALYTAVTTATTQVEGGSDQPKTVTTITLKTVYTPLKAEEKTYAYIQKTVETVTHEAAGYKDGDGNAITKGDFEALKAVFTRQTEETILWAGGDKSPTRSYLVITEPVSAETAEQAAAPIPLRLESCSTAVTNIRLGITATLTRPASGSGTDTVTALALRAGTGAAAGREGYYYLGLEKDGKFVELFRFKPSVGTDYGWEHNTAETGESKVWNLFDLTRTVSVSGTGDAPATQTRSVDIPEVPEPATEGGTAEPVRYSALDELRVVSDSDFIPKENEEAKTAFEQSFNELYCSGAPVIDLSVHYYVKQSAYMDWTEFYSDSLRFTVPG